MTFRCGRQDNIEFLQTPFTGSAQLPNGEYTQFTIWCRCRECHKEETKQRQGVSECRRIINLMRIKHNTCHLRALVKR